MIDKSILDKMDYSEVSYMLHHNQEVLDKLQENPNFATVAGISFKEASADIFSEQAQLFRRMADIYDMWVSGMREN